MQNNSNDYVILINKPVGMTSFAVTSSVKRRLGIKKAGHAGTLDPAASGVLPVMTGRAARLIDIIPDNTKRYTAGFMLGLTTDTLDCEGEVLSEQPVKCGEDDIIAAVNSFVGEIMQTPPMYSALKSGGVKLYELARKGIEIERKQRTVTIHNIEILRLERKDDTFVGEIAVSCSKGTYIRTLIDDIGMKLGCGAVMTTLERSASNGFELSQCVDLDEFMHSDNPQEFCKSPDFAVMGLSEVRVTKPQGIRFQNGGALDIQRLRKVGEMKIGTLCRVYYDGIFCGVGEFAADELKPVCVFN